MTGAMTSTMTSTMTRLRRGLLLECLLLLTISTLTSYGFPLIAEIDVEETRCFRFNVPEDDDAHMMFMAMHSEVPEIAEDWFISTVNDWGRKGEPFPDEFSIADEIEKLLEDEDEESRLLLRIDKLGENNIKNEELHWYRPVVFNNWIKEHEGKPDYSKEPSSYSICFENHNEELDVRLMFEIVLVSGEFDDESSEEEVKKLKKEHFTPLEQSLKKSIASARQIVNTMGYMEKREAVMRLTADNINARIRFFSYVSISILLGVTFLQVKYLKGYFRKKKLM